MRFLSLLRKAALEGLRDWKMLSLAVTFAPFFVVLMHAYFDEAESPIRLLVVNRDQGVVAGPFGSLHAGDLLQRHLEAAAISGEGPLFEISEATDLPHALERMEGGRVDLVVEIPEEFSQALLAYQQAGGGASTVVRTYGDPANSAYRMAALWGDLFIYEYASGYAERPGPVVIEPETAGGGSVEAFTSLTDYEMYVPGLLALAVMMLMFTAAGTLIREKDQGTLVRLRMSRMRTVEWLLAVGLIQVILGLIDVGLTLATAVVLDFELSASLLALAVVTALSSLSIMSFSILVAASLRTVFDLVTIGSFPFFILMFFSGGMFPLPPVRLFDLGSRAVNLNDILPTTHTIRAYERILNQGAELLDVGYQMGAIALLTVAFSLVGGAVFRRRHMRAA